ncbi:TSUP family transporter, partial [Escherichia coli]|uniref:TSUP family transporter n=2 Tax=Gammaproteobacteria TaxID=1236 RepID=UPI001C437A11
APFLMMYLLSCQLSKTDIVIISNLNFIASKLVQLTLLFPILISLQTHQRHILLGIMLFALIGVWLGGKIRHRLSQQHFKYLVLFFLFGLGIYALWQSVGLLQHSTILFK